MCPDPVVVSTTDDRSVRQILTRRRETISRPQYEASSEESDKVPLGPKTNRLVVCRWPRPFRSPRLCNACPADIKPRPATKLEPVTVMTGECVNPPVRVNVVTTYVTSESFIRVPPPPLHDVQMQFRQDRWTEWGSTPGQSPPTHHWREAIDRPCAKVAPIRMMPAALSYGIVLFSRHPLATTALVPALTSGGGVGECRKHRAAVSLSESCHGIQEPDSAGVGGTDAVYLGHAY